MSKATLLTFAQSQGLAGLDATSLGDFYDSFVKELGYAQLLTNFTTLSGLAGTRTYDSPAQVIDLQHVFWADTGQPATYIPFTDFSALEATNRDWRSASAGIPVTAAQEDVKENSFIVYPTPANAGTITLVYTETRTDVPPWLEPLIAYEILAREFARESKYQDAAMVDPSRFIAKLYGALTL